MEEGKALIDQIMQTADNLAGEDGYSNPQATLTVAESPLRTDPNTGAYILPTSEEIILRLFYGWMYLRIQTLCDLSQFKRRTVERALASLLKKGCIRKVGRSSYPTYFVLPDGDPYASMGPPALSNEDIYTLGPNSPAMPPYDFRPTIECTPAKPGTSDVHGLETSRQIVIPIHPYYVTEVAAWIARGLARNSFPCLAVPEQVLRRVYGWCSIKKDQPRIYFKTPVPDAWLLYGPYRLRLEVQVSRTMVDKMEDVISHSPLNEPVLYVVSEESIYQSLVPLLSLYPHLFVVRMWNDADLAAVSARYQCLVKAGGFHPWWMADHYSGPQFAHAVMNPEAACLFERNRPGGKRDCYKWPEPKAASPA